MSFSRCFVTVLLLFTIPSDLIFSNEGVPEYLFIEGYNLIIPTDYQGLLGFVESIENGEYAYSSEEEEQKIAEFISFLARTGSDGKEQQINRDIEDLLAEEQLLSSDAEGIRFANHQIKEPFEKGSFILCSSKKMSTWRKFKRFIKKYKLEIMVAVAVIVISSVAIYYYYGAVAGQSALITDTVGGVKYILSESSKIEDSSIVQSPSAHLLSISQNIFEEHIARVKADYFSNPSFVKQWTKDATKNSFQKPNTKDCFSLRKRGMIK